MQGESYGHPNVIIFLKWVNLNSHKSDGFEIRSIKINVFTLSFPIPDEKDTQHHSIEHSIRYCHHPSLYPKEEHLIQSCFAINKDKASAKHCKVCILKVTMLYCLKTLIIEFSEFTFNQFFFFFTVHIIQCFSIFQYD